MLIFFFPIMINAAKNKCSDVSIFKGKARNVDYMSSCKLRVFTGEIFLFPCINTSGTGRGNGWEHAVHNSRFQGFATTWIQKFFSLFQR